MAQTPRVRDVMMPDFLKLDGVTRVSDALRRMQDGNMHVALVEPRNEDDVYGIMTLKDVARKVIGERLKVHETHVYEIMSKPVLSVQASMPIPYAARLLTNFNVSYAMVMESNDVVGMISLNGIVKNWREE
ncbi:CBS domain-containing protein [Nitrospina watsonii]|uniref:CBS domain-containing protein n=1 Tax=Nitrospina watsonii TaxID=1323948 RepID=A0ABN8VX58_9BACT|nr:CBS domain-containing protein [Nitrospina watsonii]CAI2718347.1 CBS domain-containing protein [Nitrospina watsonii]